MFSPVTLLYALLSSTFLLQPTFHFCSTFQISVVTALTRYTELHLEIVFIKNPILTNTKLFWLVSKPKLLSAFHKVLVPAPVAVDGVLRLLLESTVRMPYTTRRGADLAVNKEGQIYSFKIEVVDNKNCFLIILLYAT